MSCSPKRGAKFLAVVHGGQAFRESLIEQPTRTDRMPPRQEHARHERRDPGMNLSDTARLRTLTLQRAVVYDGDAQRAERVADVLRTLGLEPLLIDHSALMRAVIQTPSTPPALLIGDVADCDWRELCAALREQLGDVPVVAYGLSLIHISEPTRLLSISYAVFCLK